MPDKKFGNWIKINLEPPAVYTSTPHVQFHNATLIYNKSNKIEASHQSVWTNAMLIDGVWTKNKAQTQVGSCHRTLAEKARSDCCYSLSYRKKLVNLLANLGSNSLTLPAYL